jgi:hypothetical protein
MGVCPVKELIGVLHPNHGGLSLWGTDGKLIKRNHFAFKQRNLISRTVRFDSQGAIYFGTSMHEPDELMPNGVKGRLPRHVGFNPWPRWNYRRFIGSVVKVRPEGGLLDRDGSPSEYVGGLNDTGLIWMKTEGVEWLRLGFSPMGYRDSMNYNCSCDQGNFDIDPSDRIFIPNGLMSEVTVVDRNNNLINRFGRYGNADAAGPGSTMPDVDLPVAWPACVSAGDKYLYVGDTVNDRVVRTKLVYGAEGTATVKAP